MPRTLSASLSGVLAGNDAPTALLLDLETAGVPRYIASRSITWAGNVYPAGLIYEGSVKQSRSLQLDSATVGWQNVDLEFSEILKTDLLQGSLATVKRLYLTAQETVTIFDGIVAAGEIEGRSARLRLVSKLDPSSHRLPQRSYQQLCAWKFKSAECGYVGVETVCNKTFADCTARAQVHRYSGFIQLTRAVEETVPPPVEAPSYDPNEDFLSHYDPDRMI